MQRIVTIAAKGQNTSAGLVVGQGQHYIKLTERSGTARQLRSLSSPVDSKEGEEAKKKKGSMDKTRDGQCLWRGGVFEPGCKVGRAVRNAVCRLQVKGPGEGTPQKPMPGQVGVNLLPLLADLEGCGGVRSNCHKTKKKQYWTARHIVPRLRKSWPPPSPPECEACEGPRSTLPQPLPLADGARATLHGPCVRHKGQPLDTLGLASTKAE